MAILADARPNVSVSRKVSPEKSGRVVGNHVTLPCPVGYSYLQFRRRLIPCPGPILHLLFLVTLPTGGPGVVDADHALRTIWPLGAPSRRRLAGLVRRCNSYLARVGFVGLQLRLAGDWVEWIEAK